MHNAYSVSHSYFLFAYTLEHAGANTWRQTATACCLLRTAYSGHGTASGLRRCVYLCACSFCFVFMCVYFVCILCMLIGNLCYSPKISNVRFCIFVYPSIIHTHLSQYIQLRCHAWGEVLCFQTEYLCFYHSCMLYCCVLSFVWQSCLKDQSGNLHDRWSLFLYEVCVCHLCVICVWVQSIRVTSTHHTQTHTNTHTHTHPHPPPHTHPHSIGICFHTLFFLDLLFCFVCVCVCVCVSQVSQTQYASALQGYDMSILEQIKDLVFAQIDELRCEFLWTIHTHTHTHTHARTHMQAQASDLVSANLLSFEQLKNTSLCFHLVYGVIAWFFTSPS